MTKNWPVLSFLWKTAMASALTLDQMLKRLIYLNSAKPEFHVGDPDMYQVKSQLRLTTLEQAIEDDLEQLFQVLDEANTNPNLPRRSIIFLVLALVMHSPKVTGEQKAKAMAKVLELSSSDQDFFGFIRQYTRNKKGCKMPTSVAKGVRKFYGAKSPLELAQAVAEAERICTWTHKDLIKLAHVKADSVLKNVVLNYILTRQLKDGASEQELEVLDVIRKAERLRNATDPTEAVLLLRNPHLELGQLTSTLCQSEEVWAALLPKLRTQDILARLLKLHKLNLLHPDSPISKQVVQLLTCPKRTKDCRILPLEVFIQIKRLEKGGKPADPKLLNYLKTVKKLSEEALEKARTRPEVKCAHIVSALWRCFELACTNLVPTNKRYLVAIDVPHSGLNERCIGSKVVTFLEAAVAYAVVLQRVEQHVTVAVHQEDTLRIIHVKKQCAFHHVLQQVSAHPSANSSLSTCISWASSQQQQVDVFVNFVRKAQSALAPVGNVSVGQSILSYRAEMNLPNAKFIIFTLLERLLAFWDDAPANVLTIMGFDAVACKVAECFSRNEFC